MNKIDFKKYAQYCARLGISVVPPRQDGTKAPYGNGGKWQKYITELPDQQAIDYWYPDNHQRTGIGFVCGKVSNNLECIDFDDRGTYIQYQTLCREIGISDILEKVCRGYLENTPNGSHILYRCAEIEGSIKLAKKEVPNNNPMGPKTKVKTLIETKGEGGYIIVAPTYGSVNDKGPYTLVSGGVDHIQTITPNERKELLDAARSLNEYKENKTQQSHCVEVPYIEGDRPGDIFNQKVSWDEILVGWKKLYTTTSGVTHWRRPGKNKGMSATTNFQGNDMLHVFTTSTEFEGGTCYSKFTAYALLNFNGDFESASRELYKKGYRTTEVAEINYNDVYLEDLLNNLLSKEKPEKATPNISSVIGNFNTSANDNYRPQKAYDFPNHLFDIPGALGECVRWIDKTSDRSHQRVFALSASIAAFATVLGRKVRTDGDVRPNIYIMNIGGTGCGKNRSRNAIKQLFNEVGQEKRAAVDEIASDAALEEILSRSPSFCWLKDEAGFFIQSSSGVKTPQHIRQIKPTLMTLHSSEKTQYSRSVKKGDLKNSKGEDKEMLPPIYQPNLVFYGTSTPGMIFDNITHSDIESGFIARLLTFETECNFGLHICVDPSQRQIPPNLLTVFDYWENHVNYGDNTKGNLVGTDMELLQPDPKIIRCTPDARLAFQRLDRQVQKIRYELEKKEQPAGIYSRVAETAEKLALIRACGNNYLNPEIVKKDAEWAGDLVLFTMQRFLDNVKNKVGERTLDSDMEMIYRIIESSEEVIDGTTRKKTIQLSRLTRKLGRKLSKKDKDEVIEQLGSEGYIGSFTVGNSKNKKGKKYFQIMKGFE